MLNLGLRDEDIKKIQDIFRRFDKIQKAIVYGSRAMGNYREGSDIDITLFGNISFEILGRIYDALDDVLLPYEIDLSIYDHIKNGKLKEHINRVGKKIYERE